MNGYSEFYLEKEELIIHTECYNGTARHYTDYRLTKEQVKTVIEVLGIDEDVVKYLTKRYSNGITILSVLYEHGVKGEVIDKGYEDTSSDI